MKNKRDIVGTQKIASILGISDRRVQQLVTAGVLKKEGRGRYDLINSVHAYMQYQIDLVKEKHATGTLLEEQTRLTKLKADKEQMDIERLQGETLPVGEILNLWQQFVIAARTQMLSIPSTVKTTHPELSMKVVSSIENIVRKILKGMSKDGLPEKR